MKNHLKINRLTSSSLFRGKSCSEIVKNNQKCKIPIKNKKFTNLSKSGKNNYCSEIIITVNSFSPKSSYQNAREKTRKKN